MAVEKRSLFGKRTVVERADCSINNRQVIFMTAVEKRSLFGKRTVVERTDCSINNRRVIFMTAVEKRSLFGKRTVVERADCSINNQRVIFMTAVAKTIVAAGRNEAPCISDSSGGFRRLLDPYVSTYRAYHKPFSVDDQYGIGAKDQITLYSEFNTPKVHGFGPRHKEIWMPQTSKVHRAVYDRIHVKKEAKEVAACHNPVNNIKGVFVSETKSKYKIPFAVSPLATWAHGEEFDLAPFPPNPYQTNIAPFMYCSDYCHISQGTPPSTVVDQMKHQKAAHKGCKTGYVVSRD
ncbi:Uncharacterized protein OBRU01_07906 [Operophtera brumata]|uniref:Uncharacterized protein n=1 Tax=Operophtera brumata TaxID=104452 RepID=A0A0L7LIK0_OPEBR|nr:Uncharacterized protein OBRU01_07906 [Operophtera brumata]